MNRILGLFLLPLGILSACGDSPVVPPVEPDPSPPEVSIESVTIGEEGPYLVTVEAVATAYDGTWIGVWGYEFDHWAVPERRVCAAGGECAFDIFDTPEGESTLRVIVRDSEGREGRTETALSLEVPRLHYRAEFPDLGPEPEVAAVAPTGLMVGTFANAEGGRTGFLYEEGTVRELGAGFTPTDVNGSGDVVGIAASHPGCDAEPAGLLLEADGTSTVVACGPASLGIHRDGTVVFIEAGDASRVHSRTNGESLSSAETGLDAGLQIISIRVGGEGTIAIEYRMDRAGPPESAVQVVPASGAAHDLCQICALAGIDGAGRVGANMYQSLRTGPRSPRPGQIIRSTEEAGEHERLTVLHYHDWPYFRVGGVNSAGDIAGGGQRAIYLWRDGTTFRLEVENPPEVPGGMSDHLRPVGIDDAGRIVAYFGWGSDRDALILVPLDD